MENQKRVEKKLAELNNRSSLLSPSTLDEWSALPGFNAITGFSFGTLGQPPYFNPTNGYPVKIFINKRTGEIKIYSAYLFIGE